MNKKIAGKKVAVDASQEILIELRGMVNRLDLILAILFNQKTNEKESLPLRKINKQELFSLLGAQFELSDKHLSRILRSTPNSVQATRSRNTKKRAKKKA